MPVPEQLSRLLTLGLVAEFVAAAAAAAESVTELRTNRMLLVR